MHIRSLEEAPSVNDYLTALEQEESCHESRAVVAENLTLMPGGLLRAGHRAFEVLEEAPTDLAKLARIPGAYFAEIDAELRAANFNARLPRFFGREEVLDVTTSKDNAVRRVRRPRFGRVPPYQAIETLVEAVPGPTVSNSIRVVEYERDRRLDVAVIARALEVEPRTSDIVCGGVHLTIEENGAVQVGPESFRLVCRNGAMARVCTGGQHRLRRGHGKHSDRRFMAMLREFARTARRGWEHVKRGLEALARKPLDPSDIGHVVHGLRQSLFFISARATGRVEEQLRSHTDDLTFYDLHNAITYVGTHDGDVLPQYRHRLRLGAGQSARGRVGVCHECRRLMIGGETSRN
jgi:hypothetical protein